MEKWLKFRSGTWLREAEAHPQVESSPGSFHWVALPDPKEERLALGTACLSAVDTILKLAQHPGRAAWGRAQGCSWGRSQREDDLSPGQPSPPGANVQAPEPHLDLELTGAVGAEPRICNWGSCRPSWTWKWRESHPEGLLKGSQGAEEGLAWVQPSLAPG